MAGHAWINEGARTNTIYGMEVVVTLSEILLFMIVTYRNLILVQLTNKIIYC